VLIEARVEIFRIYKIVFPPLVLVPVDSLVEFLLGGTSPGSEAASSKLAAASAAFFVFAILKNGAGESM
jgi:hypothetical protein